MIKVKKKKEIKDEIEPEELKKEALAVEVVTPIEEEAVIHGPPKVTFDKEKWKPRTSIGMMIKKGEISDINVVLDSGIKIMEAEIVDALVPGIEMDLLMIGQSKGKFGGGQRRVFRQTQKKTAEGNKPSFSTFAVVGNRNGIIGGGLGKSKETVPAREKAVRQAKLNVIKIRRGCGSWHCNCKEHHSIPFTVVGKCGSTVLKLMPAPKGKGLCIEKECAKILALAGIKDVWAKKNTKSATKVNLLFACMDALNKLVKTKIQEKDVANLNIVEGIKNG